MPQRTKQTPFDPRALVLGLAWSMLVACGPCVPADVRSIGPATRIECQLPPGALGDVVSFDLAPKRCGPPDLPDVRAHVEADGSYVVYELQEDLGEGGSPYVETRHGCYSADEMRAIRAVLESTPPDVDASEAQCAPTMTRLVRAGTDAASAGEAGARVPAPVSLALARTLARMRSFAPAIDCEGPGTCEVRFSRNVEAHVHGQKPAGDLLSIRHDGIIECRHHERAEARRIAPAAAARLISYLLRGIPLDDEEVREDDDGDHDNDHASGATHSNWLVVERGRSLHPRDPEEILARWNAVAERIFRECRDL